MLLYHPEKYPVITGKKSNLALCTCWTDPQIFNTHYQKERDNFAIIGTLYSREGVSILIRNLCLNPHIDTVILWAHNPLSRTPIGETGRNMLVSLWRDGIGEDHRVATTGEHIHGEIELSIVESLRKRVKLIDMSECLISDLKVHTQPHKKAQLSTSLDPISFPDPVRTEQTTWPSEEVGWAVHGATIPEVWVKLADRIMRYGHVKKTENGTDQKELQVVNWTIKNTSTDLLLETGWPEEVKRHIGLNHDICDQYKQIFLTPTKPEGNAYTYGSRLFDFPGNIDQVKHIIKHLKKNSNTRQAFATTFSPKDDSDSANPPCLTSVQFLKGSGNKLNMSAYFRSHDIGKAAIPNAYGLCALLQYVSQKVGMKSGSLTITSASAHIYEPDWKIITDTLKCALWDRPKVIFDEHEDLDPRGVVRIQVRQNIIVLELLDPQSGSVITSIEGTKARRMMMKLTTLNLLSRPDHYADIAFELMKAEIAIRMNVQYEQDKAISIHSIRVT